MFNKELPDCIVVDLDGTLAHSKNRSPYEWDKVGSDEVDDTIANIINSYQVFAAQEGFKIILVSGRDSVCRNQTISWLKNNDIPYDELYMRPEGDTRKDTIIKTEIYNEHIKDKYNVLFVLDDRDCCVKMWRELGLKALQVEEGNF